MFKQWKKFKLWLKMSFFLPAAYISAVRVAKKDFGLRYEVARKIGRASCWGTLYI